MNRTKISLLYFFQFFLWGAWFATLGQCLGANGLADYAGGAYGAAPWGAILAPLFLGVIADRFFPSQVVMGVLFLLGGAFLWLGYGAAQNGDGGLMVNYFVAHMLCYMPTLGLGNTVAFSHLSREEFPSVRVWGTVGWIMAGLIVGLLGWTSDLLILPLAAGCSVMLGGFCFMLPHTPAPAKGEKVEWRALLMVDAVKLMAKPAFLVFLICSTLICIPLAYYYGLTSNYLTNAGFKQAASAMTIGQMSEIILMLMIPFFFRKLGVKWMLFVGMMSWVLRYVLFAWGASEQAVWMLFAGVALHGICYDFFFVTGFMYTDKVAPEKVRGQAQSLLVFLTQGVGMYFGYQVAFGKFAGVEHYGELDRAMNEAAELKSLSFVEQMGQMFSVEMPKSVDGVLVSQAMEEWRDLWLFAAGLAAVIALMFLVAFWDRTKVMDE